MTVEFPVGYFAFNDNEAFNFQLNRFYSQGAFTQEELMDIGRKIDGFETWIELFTQLGEKVQDIDPFKAATCFRAAQFYTLAGQKDAQGNDLKHVLYEKCVKLYNACFAKIPHLEFTRIPFEDYEIPVYYSTLDNAKGDIVIHGGYDSIAQEFVAILPWLMEKGYNVYMFEGPGQGEVLMHHDKRMTLAWEHCTGAVLDYFQLNDVTLIGISLGGYLGTRAAAYDKRIKRLVMYDLIYDFYGALLAKMGKYAKLFDFLVNHPRNILWHWLNRQLDANYFTKWLLLQGYAIYENIHTPCEYFNYIKQFNTRDISRLITQDSLVLAGEADIYTIFYQDQLNALSNAKSVTGRLFTKEENADHHCQIGNMPLLLETIVTWIEEKSNG